MNIKTLMAAIAFILLAAAPKAFTQDATGLCYEGHCFASTLDDFLEQLSDDTDYKLSGLGSFKFLKLNTPVDINSQSFNVQYSEMTVKKSKFHTLGYAYDFTPRSKTMCQERYRDLLKSLNSAHGPLKAGKKPKKSEGYTNKKIEAAKDLFYWQNTNELGTYKNNLSKTELTSDIIIRVSSTEMSSATPSTPKTPSCKLAVAFVKAIK